MKTLMVLYDLKTWIGVLGFASELAITASHVVIAASLFRLKAHAKPAYRTLGLLALLASLCAFREIFGLLENWRVATEALSSGSSGFSVLKSLAAIFWVVTACRLPAVLRSLSQSQAMATRADHPDEGDHHADLRKSGQIASEMKQLSLKARMLQNCIHNEALRFNKLHKTQNIIIPSDDMEMIPCQI